MDDAGERIVFPQDGHRHDSVRFHAIYYRACQLIGPRSFGRTVDDALHGNAQDVLFALHRPREIAGGHDADDSPAVVEHDRDAAPLGQQWNGLPHRIAGAQYRQTFCLHDLVDLGEETTPQRAPRMQAREVLTLKPLLLEERDRERIPNRQRDRRARRGREIVRARLDGHGRVEHDVGVSRHRRSTLAGERDQSNAETLEGVDEGKELVRLATLRDEQRHVVGADDPEIAVRAVRRVKEGRRRPGRGERRGDLAPDQSGFADARHNHASLRVAQQLDGAGKAVIEALERARNGVALEFQHATPAVHDARLGLLVAHVRALGLDRSAT